MAYTKSLYAVCSLILLLFASCGAQGESYSAATLKTYDQSPSISESYADAAKFHLNSNSNRGISIGMGPAKQLRQRFDGEGQDLDDAALPSSNRKIIYDSRIDLVVEQFDGISQKIIELANEVGGFIASENTGKMRGSKRSGNWVVRVPVLNYSTFLGKAAEIGILESQSQTAQDVTAQYVDLVARISNSKRLEERILHLLERKDAQLKSIIEVENELARVRGQIEQMEGSLRVLSDQTSLATVTISVREEVNYVPPNEPTFASKVSDAWTGSFTALTRLGKDTVIFLVAMVPWALIIVLLILIAYVIAKVFRKPATA